MQNPPQTAPSGLIQGGLFSTTTNQGYTKAYHPPKTAKQGSQPSLRKNINPWEQQIPVSLPLRGRPVTIGDRTRELVGRCENLKKNF